jgi:hypothetical protein
MFAQRIFSDYLRNSNNKFKGRRVLLHAMKAYSRGGGVAPLTLNLRTECDDWFDLRPNRLYPANKYFRHSFNRRLGVW